MAREPLMKDKTHHRETHARWSKPLEWRADQCGGCRFWVPLAGVWGLDWGVCSHSASDKDGRLMFEHDGCTHHDRADEWVMPADAPNEFD